MKAEHLTKLAEVYASLKGEDAPDELMDPLGFAIRLYSKMLTGNADDVIQRIFDEHGRFKTGKFIRYMKTTESYHPTLSECCKMVDQKYSKAAPAEPVPEPEDESALRGVLVQRMLQQAKERKQL